MSAANVCPHCEREQPHTVFPVHTYTGSDILCGSCGGMSRVTLTREKIEDSDLSEEELSVVNTCREQLEEMRGNGDQA